eukprot:TRINITY_DN26098_c0_g3_i1.p1 TRINITY_DN26098_c0_g3~~TRINITY_DN26098_c0_g3_i1.p1  ORF type:complete len:306 (+),score=55.51 TRINITY_DN26098_c0_g3_i1:69-986(+)
MADMAAARLLRAAGALPAAPPAAGGKATGAGMAIFVRVPGIPDAVCVELAPDATVGDLRREAEAQAEGRRVGRLRYAGEPLADEAVPLADAGIGPQAVVDVEASVLLSFVEEFNQFGGDSYKFANNCLPVSALEGLRLTNEAPPHVLPLGSGSHLPVWVEAAPAAEAVAAGIRPGMLLKVRNTAGRMIYYPFAEPTPEKAQAKLQEILQSPEFQQDGVQLCVLELPPVVTVAVDPETTLEAALHQAAEERGFKLEETEHEFKFYGPGVPPGSGGSPLTRAMRCGDIDPSGTFIEWEDSMGFGLFD